MTLILEPLLAGEGNDQLRVRPAIVASSSTSCPSRRSVDAPSVEYET